MAAATRFGHPRVRHMGRFERDCWISSNTGGRKNGTLAKKTLEESVRSSNVARTEGVDYGHLSCKRNGSLTSVDGTSASTAGPTPGRGILPRRAGKGRTSKRAMPLCVAGTEGSGSPERPQIRTQQRMTLLVKLRQSKCQSGIRWSRCVVSTWRVSSFTF